MNQKKNPLLAAILSFVIAGLGQLYLGKFSKAAIFFLLEVITAGIYLITELDILSIINLLVSIISAYDAHRTAKEINMKIKLKPKTKDLSEIPEIYIE